MRSFCSGIFFAFLSLSLPAQDRSVFLRKILLDAKSETVLVAAHRASHRHFPENSLPAIREAIRQGVDIIETDVKITADGVPILMHDRTINRTTTGKGDPEKITWSELKKLSLVVNGKPTGERIPTLEEALLEAKGKILVDLDMKTDAVPAVLEIVRKTGTQDIVIFFDSDRDVLRSIQAAGNFLVMARAEDKTTTEEVIRAFSPPVVHTDPEFSTPELVDYIRSNNARIWVNTLGALDKVIASGDGIEAVRPIVEAGVNIIQTDEPQLLIGLLHQLGKRPDISAPIENSGKPLVSAHRSKISRKSTENTLSTMQQALQAGADYIEIDVRTTKDGHIVNMHDSKIDRTTESTGEVRNLTLDEIQKVKLKKAQDSEKIPTLDEIGRLLDEWNRKSRKKARLYVDCKDADPVALLNILTRYNLQHDAVFYGSDETLARLREADPQVNIMPALRSPEELARKAALLRPYSFDVNWKILNPEIVKSIHGYGIKVFTDLLALHDKRKNYRKAGAYGLDVMQSDRLSKIRD